MHLPCLARSLTAFAASLSFSCGLHAQDDVQNPTSNSREVQVVPAPGAVIIDGDDKDWDLSAGIWSYNDPTLVKKYSMWTHLMWDAKGVYLLSRYSDPSPMKNATRGKDFSLSWKADAFQGRLIFDDKTPDEHQMHVNLFYSSVENAPYMIVKHGGFKAKPPYDGTGPDRPDQLEKFGVTMDAAGGKIAFKTWDDGQGYNMEAFWPWSYLRTSGKPLAPGDSFVFGLEGMWGSRDGTKMIHRLVDNMKDDKVNRIFFFRAREGWGKAILSAKGNLDVTASQKALQAARLKLFVDYDTQGPVAIPYTLTADRDVTIAIDNAQGVRVRNLFGQYPRSAGSNTDYWDGLDDKGAPVPAGDYTVRILDHAPITVRFHNSLYNAATPPWANENGAKYWGSNHGHPTTAATRGDVTIIGFTGTEGTTGVLRTNPEGIIQWSDASEILDATIGEKYVYTFSRESYSNQVLLRRFDLETGKLVLFENAERSPEIKMDIGIKETPNASTIALSAGKLYVFVPAKGLYIVDAANGQTTGPADIPGLLAINDRDEKLTGLFSDGSIGRLDAAGKPTSRILKAAGLKQPVRFAESHDGKRFAISDQATNQVFVYDAAGKLIQTIGQPYAAIDGKRP
ncbi:MAG: FlgD immunoglobulin-like domain containing protein, partial [Rariglobus sp.]